MQVTVITTGVFLFIALGVYVLGRVLVGAGRNQADDAARRPLALGAMTQPLAATLPALTDTELPKDLRRAGYYHPLAAKEYLAIRNALLWGWLLVCLATYGLIVQGQPRATVLLAVVGTVVLVGLYSLPRLLLQAQAAGRLQRIERSLPDGLDMITMVMEGGLPLVSALDHVSREMGQAHPDLACELNIVAQHTRARSLDDALRRFAERIDTPDVQSLAALVAYSERLGSNVAGAFREFADGVRRSFRQRAEERGNKASVKLLFPVVLCLAPPVYILLLAPALLELRSFVIEQNQPGGVLSQETAATNPLTATSGEGPGILPVPDASN